MLVGSLCVALWLFVIVPAQTSAAMTLYAIALVFWLVVAPVWLARGWRIRYPLLLALTGVMVLLPMWLAMVQLQAEPQVLLILMAILWVSDTAAFLCGKQWGRHKLAPSISPGKTWEGVAGAVAGVTLYYAVINAAFPTGHAVLTGLTGLAAFWLLTALGVEGDLFESWIKRTAGVKDSGTALPGHGGVLDRVDALTSAMPAAALLLAWAV
jgi:phosphatidate cytidylyltransferase